MMGRLALVAAAMIAFLAPALAETRIKDIAELRGIRSNHLIGYGLVVGLNGTGDSLRNAPFTQQSMQSMLDRMGVNVRGAQPRTRNIAAVMVTAELPSNASKGSRIDVTVASLGDASSLSGGSLLMTPLMGANDVIYAVAQGPIAVTGFSAQGKAEQVYSGVPTAGRIPNGASVERDAPETMSAQDRISLELRNPDFSTAVAVVDAINSYAKNRFGMQVAAERDFKSIDLRLPPRMGLARFMAEVGELNVLPDQPARVVIDERTGTIVIGKDVRISTVAVSHGNISVRITESASVSQPAPFSGGKTVITPQTTVGVANEAGPITTVYGSSLQELVTGLNRMGLRPNGIIAVLQAVKTAGALQAELVVQ
jgi:flagellar P-ring protein precursor FlgI